MRLSMNQKTAVNSQTNKNKSKIWTIPNILSFLRLALIPIICVLYFIKDGILASIALVLSALTDVVDGFIARRFDMVSDFGKALDPIADKLTQAVVLVCLASRFSYMLSVFTLLLVKDVVTGAISLYVTQKTGTVNGAVWHGKLTTVLLYGTMFLHLIWQGISPLVSYILISLSAAVMLMSFILYAVRNYQLIQASKNNKIS